VNSDFSRIETDAQKAVEDNRGERQKEPPRRGSFGTFLAFLMALVALAGTAWLWWQDQSSSGQEESRVSAELARLDSSDRELGLKLRQLGDQLDSLAAADGGEQLTALEGRLAADRARLEQADRAIREQVALAQSLQAALGSMEARLRAAEAALSTMNTRQLDAGGELDLAEVDYLLRLASERLQLFADPAAADQALELADRQLAAMNNPAYLGVRQDISAARQALAGVEIPNYLDLAAGLDDIQAALPELPFRGERESPEAAESAVEDGWWGKLKSVFASLVTVRRSTDEEISKVSLEDKDYVRQRVWLQLEIAHLSLMRRDQAAFRSAVGRVQESLGAWFEPADTRVQSVAARLSGMAALEVDAALPDISTPWSNLNRIRAASSTASPAAPPAADRGEQDGSNEAAPQEGGQEPAGAAETPAETPAETGSQAPEDP
jgi:uroporphyrin-3 C-methyltransferase